MLGRLGFSPKEMFRMPYCDVIATIDGFFDGIMDNKEDVRNLMWSNLSPWVKGITPKKIMTLPTDRRVARQSMTKDEFLKLAEHYRPKAKA